VSASTTARLRACFTFDINVVIVCSYPVACGQILAAKRHKSHKEG
jgi:hypothetical protein